MNSIYIGRGKSAGINPANSNKPRENIIPRNFTNYMNFRGNNSVTNNLEHITHNLELSNLASNPAARTGSWLAPSIDGPTAPVGEKSERPTEEEVVISRGNIIPRTFRSVLVQQCRVKTKRPRFHLTVQSSDRTINATIYTYPYERLREYNPANEVEQGLYEYALENPQISVGRVMRRKSKSIIIDDLAACIEQTGDHLTLTLLFQAQEYYEIKIDRPPTPGQEQYYSAVGLWGDPTDLGGTGRARRVRLFDEEE